MVDGATGSILNAGGTGAGTGAGAGTGSGAGGAAAAAGATGSGDWFAGLPDDIRTNPSLKVFQGEKGFDLAALTTSYVNAQKMIGAEKVVIPGKNASDQDWKNFYLKMGLPESVDKYEVKLPKDAQVDENIMKAFKETALASGILPSQAEKIVAWFQQTQTSSMKAMTDAQTAQAQKGLADLKTEWGQAYDKKITEAQLAARELGDEELSKFLDESGMGSHPQMLKLFAKLGAAMAEDGITSSGAGNEFGITPDQAKKEIEDIMGDPNHPYWNANHAGNASAVDRMLKLREASAQAS